MKTTSFILALSLLLVLSTGVLQAQIVPNYGAAPGPGQRALTAAEQAVVNAAIQWWHVSHPNVGPINVDFLMDTGVAPLAVTTGFTADGSGRPTYSLIRFSDQPLVFTWYVDATPLVNEPAEVPFGQYDMLSTAAHEIAHAIGFTVNYGPFAANVGAAAPDGRRPFACAGPPPANATLVPAASGTHLDPGTHAPDLMTPSINWATRLLQSQLDMAMIGCSFGYSIDTPPVADAGPDQMVECTGSSSATAVLDGTGSSDADGNPLTYFWSASGIVFDDDTSATPSAVFPLGATVVTLTVSDGIYQSSATVVITVADTTPPDVICAPAITVECSSFCGVSSDDPQLTDFFAAFSASDVCCDVDVTFTYPDCFPLGSTVVEYEAEDCAGNKSTCQTSVTVVDTTPPEIDVTVNRDVLWPPNHKMADIVATVEVSDICCATPTFALVSVTSDEPENGLGDGNTYPDVLIIDKTHIQLRSERSGKGDGRVYTLNYLATDCSGNTTPASVEVRVPHDHAGWACASMGFQAGGYSFDPALDRFVLVIRSKPEEYFINANGDPVLVADKFDATAIDVTRAYVGNVKGVVVPNESLVIDNDADGLMDIVLYYSAPDVDEIISSMVPLEDAKISVDQSYGPIGLHYVGASGVDYLVENIFMLGEPVPIVPSVVIRRTDGLGDIDPPVDDAEKVPAETSLLDAYPNPFNPTTTIPFGLTRGEHVRLEVFDARGALVRTLKDEIVPAGAHAVTWDGRDGSGRQVATGVYFVRFRAGAVETTKKIVMLK